MGIVEELENSIDIVELVSKYTKLKKAGANYKSVCPFPGHNEKTPSFIVSPAKQLGYCFGCHKGGGALKFIMDIENVDFKEALQILAGFAGKKIDGFDDKKYKIQKNMYGLYNDATVYYKKSLENNPEAQKYLFDRGLKKEDFLKFHFGFSDSGVGLYNFLKEKGYSDDQIFKSKIFVDLKSRKDKFIGRIIFPIQNLRGDFVAFTARVIGKGEPKYLNSPVSEYYDKSEILYGLYSAKKSIVDKNFVIIVEGQMDAISLQSAGFSNTVAVSGTALTEKHLSILKRLTHKIYLSFDGDSAGSKATKLALETIKNKGFEVKIIAIPKNKDPDDILKSGKDFNEFIDRALSPIGYYIEKSNFELNSLEDKKKLLLELLEIIKSYTDSVEIDFYLKEISQKLNIKDYIVYDAFNKIKRQKVKFGIDTENQSKKDNFNIEEIAIGYIINDENNRDYFSKNIIFKQKLDGDLKLALEGKLDIEKLPLEKKDRLKASSFKVVEEYSDDTDENIKNDIDKFIKKLNTYYYNQIVTDLKQKMQSGDDNAFLKYSEIIKLAKKYNIK